MGHTGVGARRLAHGFGRLALCKNVLHIKRQHIGRGGGVDLSFQPVAHHGRDAAHVRRHTGHAQQHGLPQRIGGILNGGWQHEHVRVKERLLHFLPAETAQKFDLILHAVLLRQICQIFLVIGSAQPAHRQEALSRHRQRGIRVGLDDLAKGFQQIVKALHGIGAAGSENPVFPAALIAPSSLIKGLTQCLVAEMVLCFRIDPSDAGQVPVRSADNMARLLQGFFFQKPPKHELFPLLHDIVPPGNITEGAAPLNPLRHALGIMPGINRAKSLNADHQTVQPPRLFRSVDHGKGVAVLRPPDVDHVRLEGIQLPPELRFQLRQVHIGQPLGKEGVGAARIHLPLAAVAGAENADVQVFPFQQPFQHAVNPQSAAGGAAADGFLHFSGHHIAQPQQLHCTPSLSSMARIFPACVTLFFSFKINSRAFMPFSNRASAGWAKICPSFSAMASAVSSSNRYT